MVKGKRFVKIRQNKWTFILLFTIVLIIQIVICSIYGSQRHYLFCDEVYSYGLANCEEYAFIMPPVNLEPMNNWVSGDYFANYMRYNANSKFSFSAAFENQAEDVHPPLYYCLLHAVCSFFPDFTYGVVPGLLLNLMLLVITDGFLFYCAKDLLGSKKYAFLAVILWGFSRAGISNVMLVRMYLLLTLDLLLVLAFLIYVKNHKRKMTIKYFIVSTLIVAIGGLTHYYFYFFVLAFGGLICLALLFQKKYKDMFAYGFSLLAGLALAIAIFPATIHHVVGYRGTYVTNSLGHISRDRVKYYGELINCSLLAGLAKLVGCLLLMVIGWKFVNTFLYKISIVKKKDTQKTFFQISFERIKTEAIQKELIVTEEKVLLLFVFVATLFFTYVVSHGSELIEKRYIYPIYPFLSIIVVKILKDWLFDVFGKYKFAAVGICCLIFCMVSVKKYGVDWVHMYKDYEYRMPEVQAMSGSDCIVICNGGDWNNIYEGIHVYMNMNQCCYVYDNRLDEVSSLLASRRDVKRRLLVAIPGDPGYSWESSCEMLDTIASDNGYSGWTHIFSYYTNVFEMNP